MRRVDLQKLAERKIQSAVALAEMRHWSNAYYLAGYSVEFALKAAISKQFSADTFPDKNLVNKIFTHSFKDLVGLAGLKSDYVELTKKDSLFASHWSICSEWTPEARYQEKSCTETHYLLVAITDKEHGVLPWIKKYW